MCSSVNWGFLRPHSSRASATLLDQAFRSSHHVTKHSINIKNFATEAGIFDRYVFHENYFTPFWPFRVKLPISCLLQFSWKLLNVAKLKAWSEAWRQKSKLEIFWREALTRLFLASLRSPTINKIKVEILFVTFCAGVKAGTDNNNKKAVPKISAWD